MEKCRDIKKFVQKITFEMLYNITRLTEFEVYYGKAQNRANFSKCSSFHNITKIKA